MKKNNLSNKKSSMLKKNNVLLENLILTIKYYDEDIINLLHEQNYELIKSDYAKRRMIIDEYTREIITNYPRAINFIINRTYNILKSQQDVQKKMDDLIIERVNKILQEPYENKK